MITDGGDYKANSNTFTLALQNVAKGKILFETPPHIFDQSDIENIIPDIERNFTTTLLASGLRKPLFRLSNNEGVMLSGIVIVEGIVKSLMGDKFSYADWMRKLIEIVKEEYSGKV